MVHSVLQHFTMFYEFNNVSLCLVSRSTICIAPALSPIATSATVQLPIATGICDNAAGIGDATTKVIPC